MGTPFDTEASLVTKEATLDRLMFLIPEIQKKQSWVTYPQEAQSIKKAVLASPGFESGAPNEIAERIELIRSYDLGTSISMALKCQSNEHELTQKRFCMALLLPNLGASCENIVEILFRLPMGDNVLTEDYSYKDTRRWLKCLDKKDAKGILDFIPETIEVFEKRRLGKFEPKDQIRLSKALEQRKVLSLLVNGLDNMSLDDIQSNLHKIMPELPQEEVCLNIYNRKINIYKQVIGIVSDKIKSRDVSNAKQRNEKPGALARIFDKKSIDKKESELNKEKKQLEEIKKEIQNKYMYLNAISLESKMPLDKEEDLKQKELCEELFKNAKDWSAPDLINHIRKMKFEYPSSSIACTYILKHVVPNFFEEYKSGIKVVLEGKIEEGLDNRKKLEKGNKATIVKKLEELTDPNDSNHHYNPDGTLQFKLPANFGKRKPQGPSGP